MPGPDALGSLVTAKSTPRYRFAFENSVNPTTPSFEVSTGAVLTSAVEIGEGVARGIWAGLKMGAKAAGKARASRLARSAPADGSAGLANDVVDDGLSESRSIDESSVLEEQQQSASGSPSGGIWIKVVDLFPRPLGEMNASDVLQPDQNQQEPIFPQAPELVAHFRLPSSRSFVPGTSDSSAMHSHHSSSHSHHSSSQTVAHLSFSPDGTQFFAAPMDGRVFHIFQIHPAGAVKHLVRGVCKGEVWHLYELRRGSTIASVCEVTWDRAGRWVGVGTGRGTVRKYFELRACRQYI
jgi:hypothetical protein